MRSLGLFVILAFVVALLMPSIAPAQTHLATGPDSVLAKQVAVDSTRADGAAATVVADLGVPDSPAPDRGPRFPIELVGAGAALSTGAKRGGRKRAKDGADGAAAPRNTMPMILDSHVHLMRGKEMVALKGGVLVEDTDLTDDEIDELTARKAIRPATPKELAQLQQADEVSPDEESSGESE